MQGPSISFKGKKVKGEEKPEEELMGKRKSSPRLATTSSNDVVTSIMTIHLSCYTQKFNFFPMYDRFCALAITIQYVRISII